MKLNVIVQSVAVPQLIVFIMKKKQDFVSSISSVFIYTMKYCLQITALAVAAMLSASPVTHKPSDLEDLLFDRDLTASSSGERHWAGNHFLHWFETHRTKACCLIKRKKDSNTVVARFVWSLVRVVIA